MKMEVTMNKLLKVLLLGISLSAATQVHSAGVWRKLAKEAAVFTVWCGGVHIAADMYQSNPDNYRQFDARPLWAGSWW